MPATPSRPSCGSSPPTGHDVRPAEPFRPSLRVLSFDIENAIRERTIFTICGVAEGGGGPTTDVPDLHDTDETADPRGVRRGRGRGRPRCHHRLQHRGLRFPAPSRAGEAPRTSSARAGTGTLRASARWASAYGRSPGGSWPTRGGLRAATCDRSRKRSSSWRERCWGTRSSTVDRRNMDQEWARDPVAVMEYCEHDADLALRILERLRTVAKATDLATVAHLPLEEGLNGRTSLFIDSILIPRADARGVGVPSNHYAGRENPIEGGYVHAIRAGPLPVGGGARLQVDVPVDHHRPEPLLHHALARRNDRRTERGAVPGVLRPPWDHPGDPGRAPRGPRRASAPAGRSAADPETCEVLRRAPGRRQGADELVLRGPRLELLPIHEQGHRRRDHRVRAPGDHVHHRRAREGGGRCRLLGYGLRLRALPRRRRSRGPASSASPSRRGSATRA